MSQHDVQAFYDGVADAYDGLRFRSRYQSAVARREQEFVAQQVLPTARRVLEIGPGTGRFTEQLADHAEQLVVCDLSSKMLEQVRRRLGPRPNVAYANLRLEQLSKLADHGRFDAAVAMRVVPHIPDWRAALNEMLRAVRPGGTIAFDLWCRDSYVGWLRRLGRRRCAVLTHRLSARAIEAAITDLPALVTSTYRWGYPRLGPLALDRLGARHFPRYAYSHVFCCQKTGPSRAEAA